MPLPDAASAVRVCPRTDTLNQLTEEVNTLPKNKTHQPQLRLFLSFSRKPSQTVTHDLQAVYDGSHCICSAQAILAKTRGKDAPLCVDLPWHCPFATSSPTPVE